MRVFSKFQICNFVKRKKQSSHILMMYGGEGGLLIYFKFSDDLAITAMRLPSIWNLLKRLMGCESGTRKNYPCSYLENL